MPINPIANVCEKGDDLTYRGSITCSDVLPHFRTKSKANDKERDRDLRALKRMEPVSHSMVP